MVNSVGRMFTLRMQVSGACRIAAGHCNWSKPNFLDEPGRARLALMSLNFKS